MSYTISTSIQIDAPPEHVWTILMDFPAYSTWNPFIVEVEGEARPDAGLTVRIMPPGREPQTFKPVVLTMEAPSAFVWRGSLVIPGLFTGEHSFRLTREGDSTSFHHSERFTGLLVPVLKKMLARTEEGFHQMNAALKARAEARQ